MNQEAEVSVSDRVRQSSSEFLGNNVEERIDQSYQKEEEERSLVRAPWSLA